MSAFNQKNGSRFARLLPAVVFVGVGVFALKATDLVRAAYAEASEHAVEVAANTPAHPDYAGSEGDEVGSASEVDVMTSLSKRRRELDKREGQLTIQANMIAAAEKRVDAKIAQLKSLQAQIGQLMGQRDEAQKAQIANLVKTYSTMKPKDSARIFNNLPDEVLVPVAHDMKSDVLALILANMAADSAKALTVKLADRLALPQTTDAPAPVAAAPSVPLMPVTGAPAATAAAAPAAAPAAGPKTAAAPKT